MSIIEQNFINSNQLTSKTAKYAATLLLPQVRVHPALLRPKYTLYNSSEQCTLPLCEECLQIHEDEHRQKSEQANIILYRQAYEQVFGKLSMFVQNHKSPLQALTEQVRKDKTEAIRLIQSYFKEVESKLQEQNKFLSEIQQKFEKLKKGSIKTVIYYYSGEIVLKPLQLPQFKQIESSLKTLLRNHKDDKKEEIQTFRQRKNSEPEWSESKIEPYQPRQHTHQKKKSIFQNDKGSRTNLHRNDNGPYLDNPAVVAQEQKPQEIPRNPYENNYQRQSNAKEQKSQVENYFHQNYNRPESAGRGETNTYNGEMKNFKIQSKTLRNFQIESHLGIESAENNTYRALKELKEATGYAVNQEYRETRSRTLDKFPSMVDLKKGRENVGKLYQNQEDLTRFDRPAYEEHKAGKWNKAIHQEKENMRNYDQPASVFSQLTINETSSSANNNADFTNRRPLKTADLDTYNPMSNVQPNFDGRQRAASYQISSGLRTTMSHNNLYAAGKKVEPLLGEELKKQVLSPHEIRRMLEKKIEERNKVLSQKKELQLKINPDRAPSGQTMPMGSATRAELSLNSRGQTREGQAKYDENQNWVQEQQRPSLYNTKDSIINHIYRESRY